MNNCGQIEQEEVAKDCGTHVRDEKKEQSATGKCESERPLKTPARYLQDNIKVNLK
jgi:hypothetical protein